MWRFLHCLTDSWARDDYPANKVPAVRHSTVRPRDETLSTPVRINTKSYAGLQATAGAGGQRMSNRRHVTMRCLCEPGPER